MQYEIVGGSFPAVKCTLAKGEVMKCEGGSMSWMDSGITMSTEGGGGLGRALGRAFSGESVFFNHFVSAADGNEIVFSSSFPGSIIPIELGEGQSIIAQKGSFLACEKSVDVSIHIHEKLGSGVFGGMGFVMQKFTGPGTVFLEIDGSLQKYELAAGEVKVIDGPHLAIMGNGVSYKIERIKGAKNLIFGGEGIFNTVVQGPGSVWLQTMPMQNVAMQLYKYMPHSE
ncbi:MAG: TIGR00266 family protein [Bacillota bacterium]|nr:TIGR00266 family protein [Bacillota bacterium]